MTLTSEPTIQPARRLQFGRHIFAVMLAAFSLSLVHTVHSWLTGIQNPAFTVTTPLAWIFYLVAFALTALALREERWAQWTVIAFLITVLLVGIFYYPTTFGPQQQTTFGWFENDVYIGLLILGLYLAIQRLRRGALVC